MASPIEHFQQPAPPPSSDPAPDTQRPFKRRRSTKACIQCRRQKSRCDHSHDDFSYSTDQWDAPCHRCRVLGLECSLVEDKRRERSKLMESLKRRDNESVLGFDANDFPTPSPAALAIPIPPLLPSGFGPAEQLSTSNSSLARDSSSEGQGRINERKFECGNNNSLRSPLEDQKTLDPQAHSEIRERLTELTPIHISFQAHLPPRTSSSTGTVEVSTPSTSGPVIFSSGLGMQYPTVHPHPAARQSSRHSSSLPSASLLQLRSPSSCENAPSSTSNSKRSLSPLVPSYTSNKRQLGLPYDEDRKLPKSSAEYKTYAPSEFLRDLLSRCEYQHDQNPNNFIEDKVCGPRKRRRNDENDDGDEDFVGPGNLAEQDGPSSAYRFSNLLGQKGDPGWLESEIFDEEKLTVLSETFNNYYSPWIGFRVRPSNFGSRSFLGAVCLYLATRHCSISSVPEALSYHHHDNHRHSSFTLPISLMQSLRSRLTNQLTQILFAPAPTVSIVWGLSLLTRWIPNDLLNKGREDGPVEIWDETNLMTMALKAAKNLDIDLDNIDGRLYKKLIENDAENWENEDVEDAKLWFSLSIQNAFLMMLRSRIINHDRELSFSKSFKLVETIFSSSIDYESTSAYAGLIFCARLFQTFENICKVEMPILADKKVLDRFTKDHLTMAKGIDAELKTFSRFSAVAKPEDAPYYSAFTMLGHFCKGYFFIRGLMMLNTLANKELSTSQPIWQKGLDNPFHSAVGIIAQPMAVALEEAVITVVSPTFTVAALSSAPDFLLSAVAFSACSLIKWHLSTLELGNHDRPGAREGFNILVKLAEKMQKAALSKNDLNWRYSRLLTVAIKIWQEKATEVAFKHECSDKCPPSRVARYSQPPLPRSEAQEMYHSNQANNSNLRLDNNGPSLEISQPNHPDPVITVPSSSSSNTFIPPESSTVSQLSLGGLEANLDGFDLGQSLTQDIQTLLGRNPFEFDIFDSLFQVGTGNQTH